MDGYSIFTHLLSDGTEPDDLGKCNGQKTDGTGFHYHAGAGGSNAILRCLRGKTGARRGILNAPVMRPQSANWPAMAKAFLSPAILSPLLTNAIFEKFQLEQVTIGSIVGCIAGSGLTGFYEALITQKQLLKPTSHFSFQGRFHDPEQEASWGERKSQFDPRLI